MDILINTVQKGFDGEAKPFNTYIVTLDDETVYHVPHDVDNRHYNAIQDWVAEGNTIAEAD